MKLSRILPEARSGVLDGRGEGEGGGLDKLKSLLKAKAGKKKKWGKNWEEIELTTRKAEKDRESPVEVASS